MAKRTKTNLTFQVTIRGVQGLTIPQARSFIKDALISEQNALNQDDPIKAIDLSQVTIHLTNKETSYA